MKDTPSSPSAGASQSRREFLKKAGTAAAAVAAAKSMITPVYGQATAPSTGRVLGANDRIVVGYIGIGGPRTPGMGLAHVKSQKQHAAANNVAQAAVCDLYSVRNDLAKSTIGTSDVTAHDDYRKLLERKDIDAVVVGTHDTWHAKCSIDAMESGKHVYCEKPMTRYLDEAFAIYDVVKKTKKTFQVGSQGCTAAAWHKAAEMIQAGKIGKLVWGQGYYNRNNHKGEWNYPIDADASPSNIQWEKWLGPVAKKIPFNADHFFRWRKYYPYCAGLLGDLMPHRLHPLMLATGNPEFPKRVACMGTNHIETDKLTPGALTRDVREHIELLAEFPSGYTLVVVSSTVNAKSPGFTLYGHHATLDIGTSGEKIELTPEKHMSDEIDPESLSGLKPIEQVHEHEKNWFDCIRSGKAPNGNIDLAIRVQTVISLGEMADRMGVTCYFDEKKRKVTTKDGKEIPALTYEREVALAKA
jgi:predicted dehydrogenase